MGWEEYSVQSRMDSERHAFYTAPTTKRDDIFTQSSEKKIHPLMSPANAQLREARDSQNHPESFPIILGLDHTGSMLMIPELFVRNGMPHMMSKLIIDGNKDVAMLFLGIGDHYRDAAPLQIGQFESGDEQMDNWLTKLWLEGHGGGNHGESYMLAWYYAARHTFTDAWEKRKMKGIIITIGDEPTHPILEGRILRDIMGQGEFHDYNSLDLLKLAQEKYHVYHIFCTETATGMRTDYQQTWKLYLDDQHVIYTNDYNRIPNIIAEIVSVHYNVSESETNNPEPEREKENDTQSAPDIEVL